MAVIEHVLWLCDRCDDNAEVEPGGLCEVCREGTIRVVPVVRRSELDALQGRIDAALPHVERAAEQTGAGTRAMRILTQTGGT